MTDAKNISRILKDVILSTAVGNLDEDLAPGTKSTEQAFRVEYATKEDPTKISVGRWVTDTEAITEARAKAREYHNVRVRHRVVRVEDALHDISEFEEGQRDAPSTAA